MRAATRYERAKVACLAVQNAIRAARTALAAMPTGHHHGRAIEAPHGIDRPGRHDVLTPAQRAAAVHAHQQAAMPQEYLQGRTADPATWMRTPANLQRFAAVTRPADARRRAIEDRDVPAPAADPVGPRQEHEQQHPQPGPGRGIQP